MSCVVRALYDYSPQDTSSNLKFSKGDIIQVFTQLDSGWWDGLCQGSRGWFPSNYVTPVQLKEKSLSDLQLDDDSPVSSKQRRKSIAVAWIEKIGADGRPYYYNTVTGESTWTKPPPISPTKSSSSSNEDGDDDIDILYLPPHWTMQQTEDGNGSFFYHEITGEISWILPAQVWENDDRIANPYPSPDIQSDKNTLEESISSAADSSASPNEQSDRSLPSSRRPSNEKSPSLAATTIPPDSRRPSAGSQKSDHSSSDHDATNGNKDDVLPPNWGKKLTPQGRTYYYNMLTDETTWDLKDIDFATGTLRSRNSPSLSAQNTSSPTEKFIPPRRQSLAQRPSSPLSPTFSSSNSESSTPSNLLQTAYRSHLTAILNCLTTLNNSAVNNQKQHYIQHSSHIVESIRAFLISTATVGKDSLHLQTYSSLKSRHKNLLSGLSKLVLAAKLASGVWPPPDAVTKMLGELRNVETVVKSYVKECETLKLECNWEGSTPTPLTPLSPDQPIPQPSPTTPGSSKSTLFPLSPNTLHSRFQNPSDILHQLDQHSRQVYSTLTSLRNHILSKPGSMSPANDAAASSTLISQTRNAVTEVGQFLSVIEDINLASVTDEQSPLFQDFKIHKQSLYNNIAGLVMATQTATDPLAPSNAIDQVTVSISVVEKSVRDLLVSTKFLVEAKIAREGQSTPVLPSFPHSQPLGSPSSSSTSSFYGSPGVASYGYNAYRRSSLHTDRRPSLVPPSPAPVPVLSATPPPPPQDPVSIPKRRTRPYQANYPTPLNTKLANQHSQTTSVVSATSPTTPTTTPYSAKLKKFFGDEVLANVKTPLSTSASSSNSVASKSEKPWFLSHDYEQKELIISIEGYVKGGTLNALVEKLTSHDDYDPEFSTAFMITYRSFTNSVNLFEMLARRFTIQPPPNMTDAMLETWIEKKMTPIRLRVFNLLKFWIENICLMTLDEDREVLERCKVFARQTMRPVMSMMSVQLIKVVEKREKSQTPFLPLRQTLSLSPEAPTSPATPLLMSPPLPILPKSIRKFRFLDLDPMEVARQLTILEFNVFCKIPYLEFLKKGWNSSSAMAPGRGTENIPTLKKMIDLSNKISGWVAESILMEEDIKKRVVLIKHFVHIGEKCRQMNNFNTLVSILAALNSAHIHRLNRTWELMSAKVNASLSILKKITDPTKNFSEYRDILANVSGACVPFLGLYLTDLTFIEDGNPDFLQPPSTFSPSSSSPSAQYPPYASNQLINFTKQSKTAEIIKQIQQFQVTKYNLKSIPEIQDFLWNVVNSDRDDSELYELSLSREPKEREDQKLVRLLEESGLL